MVLNYHVQLAHESAWSGNYTHPWATFAATGKHVRPGDFDEFCVIMTEEIGVFSFLYWTRATFCVFTTAEPQSHSLYCAQLSPMNPGRHAHTPVS